MQTESQNRTQGATFAFVNTGHALVLFPFPPNFCFVFHRKAISMRQGRALTLDTADRLGFGLGDTT